MHAPQQVPHAQAACCGDQQGRWVLESGLTTSQDSPPQTCTCPVDVHAVGGSPATSLPSLMYMSPPSFPHACTGGRLHVAAAVCVGERSHHAWGEPPWRTSCTPSINNISHREHCVPLPDLRHKQVDRRPCSRTNLSFTPGWLHAVMSAKTHYTIN